MKFYDTHGHINADPLDKDVEKIIEQIRSENVFLNCIGFDLESSIKAIELAKKYPDCVSAGIAIHPNDVQRYDIETIRKQFETLIAENKKNIVVIGECGLDKHYSSEYFLLQLQWLQMHVELAEKFNLPLMLHIRDAHDEMIEFLKQHSSIKFPIIVHCFSQDYATFEKYEALNLNTYYSIPGIVTFPKAIDLQDAVKKIPIEKLLSETDCPWLAPVPNRGKTNYPYYVKFTVQKIAELRNEPIEKISEHLFNNAWNLFQKEKG